MNAGMYILGTDGDAAKQDAGLFHILCSDGSHTVCLLCTYITLMSFCKAESIFG